MNPRQPIGHAVVRLGAILLAAALSLSPSAFAGTVFGPMSGGTHGWPFGSPGSSVDLSAHGYVEAEFYIGGDAISYAKSGAWGRDGRWSVSPSSSAPFRTRLLMLRPAAPGAFNGTVVVEWLNVSSGFDIPEFFAHAREELLRGGYAWVGVSAQALGVQLSPFALKAWDPLRYGTLLHPGDAFAYDIVSQVGQAIRDANGAQLLGGLKAERVIAVGHSQSANGLATYINAIHPLARVFDGFLLHSRTAAPLPLGPGADGAAPVASIIRTDTNVPVIALQDEWSIAVAAAWRVRQPDTPTLRLWEVAGTGHLDRDAVEFTAPIIQRDLGFPSPVCVAPANAAPLRYLVDAALDRLDAWVARGEAAPHAPSSIDVAGGAVVRDGYANATGGIRLPQLDVPTATLSGAQNSGPGPCPVAGITIPFDAATLASLYGTHGAYVSRFVQAVDRLRLGGFLLDFDAADAKAKAARSVVGKHSR